MTPFLNAEGEPLILFHRPGTDRLERLVPDPEGSACFRMHPWEGAHQHLDLVVQGRIEPLASLDLPGSAVRKTATTVEGTDRQDHINCVARALDAIANSPLEKVVLSSRLSVQVDDLHPLDIVLRQAQAHPDSFSWLLHHADIGTWFGSSPEPLIEGQRPHFKTACLAGTRMLSQIGADWTDKERHEQQLVTDAVTDALRSVGCEDIRLSALETVQYGPIEHLRTLVDFRSDRRVEDIMEALHPTPAVGGTPRDAALDFISRNERHDRAYYTGWIGLEEADRVNYFVNLRCANVRDNIVTAYAGGGITAGSDPDAEWQETRSKLRSLLEPIAHWTE